MRYGLDDVRGYDSIISSQYVDYMRGITTASQPQLDFNRIAPLYAWDDYNATLNSPRFKRLNVRALAAARPGAGHPPAGLYLAAGAGGRVRGGQ